MAEEEEEDEPKMIDMQEWNWNALSRSLLGGGVNGSECDVHNNSKPRA